MAGPTLLHGSEPWFKNSKKSLFQKAKIKILEVSGNIPG
jgi:hypothetical protein